MSDTEHTENEAMVTLPLDEGVADTVAAAEQGEGVASEAVVASEPEVKNKACEVSPGRWYATGRRKEATARVYLTAGSGKIVVNGDALNDYFGRESLRMILQQPLDVVQQRGKVDVRVNVCGGGLAGQAGAIRHGLSRALIAMDFSMRGPLKAAGFVTRDAREVERKKYGRAGARRKFQFSKR